MSKRTLIAALVALTMTACASGTPPMPVIYTPVSASFKTPPQPLPAATSGSLADLWANHLAVAELYHDLADRFRRLVREVEIREKLMGPQ